MNQVILRIGHDKSGSRSVSWSRSGIWIGSLSGSGSRSRSWSRSGTRGRSWSISRSGSLSLSRSKLSK